MALFNTSKFLKEQRAGLEANIPADTEENIARAWRDQELRDTDWVIPITDHSDRAAYITYRQLLRDWPSTTDFPGTRPVRV